MFFFNYILLLCFSFFAVTVSFEVAAMTTYARDSFVMRQISSKAPKRPYSNFYGIGGVSEFQTDAGLLKDLGQNLASDDEKTEIFIDKTEKMFPAGKYQGTSPDGAVCFVDVNYPKTSKGTIYSITIEGFDQTGMISKISLNIGSTKLKKRQSMVILSAVYDHRKNNFLSEVIAASFGSDEKTIKGYSLAVSVNEYGETRLFARSGLFTSKGKYEILCLDLLPLKKKEIDL